MNTYTTVHGNTINFSMRDNGNEKTERGKEK